MKEINCNLCGKKDDEFLFEKNGYRVVKCRNCGLVYVNPQPEEDEIEKFYEGHQKFYIKRYPTKLKSKLREARREINRIKRILPYKKGIRLLDIGCGCGFLLKEGKSLGWEVTGIEICEEEVEFAIKQFGVNVIKGNFLDLNIEGKFDVITMFDLIEHLTNPSECFKKCYSLLKENRFLIIATPDVEHQNVKKEGKNWGHFKPPEHLFYFSLKTLKKMCEKAGFTYKGSFFRFPWREGIKGVFQKSD